jgi:hypothetical protein
MNVTTVEPENELMNAHAWSPRPRARRRTARLDVAVGALVALLVLLLAPGLAVVGIIATAMIALCGASALLARRRARRAGEGRAVGAVRLHPSERAPSRWR